MRRSVTTNGGTTFVAAATTGSAVGRSQMIFLCSNRHHQPSGYTLDYERSNRVTAVLVNRKRVQRIWHPIADAQFSGWPLCVGG